MLQNHCKLWARQESVIDKKPHLMYIIITFSETISVYYALIKKVLLSRISDGA